MSTCRSLFRAPDGVSLRSCCFRRGWKTARFRLALWRAKKQNLLNAMLARINDKRSYANSQLLRAMCAGQPYGVPRIGEPEDLDEITPQSLYAHYRQILETSRVELFYMGSLAPEQVTEVLRQTLRRFRAPGRLFRSERHPRPRQDRCRRRRSGWT